jgi:N-acetylmuramoyl-L-alanine amidase
LKEKTLALELARRVERLLRKGGYQVVLSRKTDVFVSLHRRVQKAEACKATIFVSIHLNSDPAAKGQGAEVYYYRAKKQKDGFRVIESRQLAHQILGHLSKDLSMMCRGVKNGDFYVIRESTMPAVLVEAAFITNPKDALLLASVPCRQKMANAIAKGIIDYFRARK